MCGCGELVSGGPRMIFTGHVHVCSRCNEKRYLWASICARAVEERSGPVAGLSKQRRCPKGVRHVTRLHYILVVFRSPNQGQEGKVA